MENSTRKQPIRTIPSIFLFYLFSTCFNQIRAKCGEIEISESNISKYVSDTYKDRNWNFTFPFAMKCTQKQFEPIREKLIEIGYKIGSVFGLDKWPYITNFYGILGVIGSIDRNISKSMTITWFDYFDYDLFLALASITDKKCGIPSEWWRSETGGDIWPNFSSPISYLYLKGCRKATPYEIIKHFSKKELKYNASIDAVESLMSSLNSFRNHLMETVESTGYIRWDLGYMVRINNKNEFNSVFEYLDFVGYTKGLEIPEYSAYPFPSYIEIKESGEWLYYAGYGRPAKLEEVSFDWLQKNVLNKVSIDKKWIPKAGELVWVVFSYGENNFSCMELSYVPELFSSFKNGFIFKSKPEAEKRLKNLKH